jgi:hypothetical protein
MKIEQTIETLEAAIGAKMDETYAKTHRFHSGNPVAQSAIAARERELDIAFPPSLRAALQKYGCFTLGELDAAYDHLVFKCLPVAEHRSALAEYAEQLECDATAAAVAEEIGLEPDVVAALDQVILVGLEGHEDYVGFDLRTRNPDTGECEFGLVLFDDTEIEALAAKEPSRCEGRGFDTWLARHVERRA